MKSLTGLRITRSFLFASLGLLCTVAVAGCGAPSGPTDGVVLFDDGTPVQSGSIEFRRLKGGDRYSSRIRSDGGFNPTDSEGRPGLPEGVYEIVVVQVVLTEDLAKAAHSHGNTVPRRYADYYTSDLRYRVAPEQTEAITLEVASK